MEPKPGIILQQLQDAIRLKHYSIRTEQAYADWARRFILFHHKRHPKEMGSPETCPERSRRVEALITHLAIERDVATLTHTVPAS